MFKTRFPYDPKISRNISRLQLSQADAEAPRAALNQLQVVPAEEDDDLPEPSEPSEHWPPQCPKGRAVPVSKMGNPWEVPSNAK